jgi:hypothetical protein
MTRSRVQTNRFFAAGARPPAASRKPGELYLNAPELQLGLVDASQTPQDLLAVRFFSPTAAYSTGVFIVNAGILYVSNTSVPAGAFNVSQWTKIGP